ncbi:MAG: transporter substrate-binding protein [Rhodobacteraceae bacterium]|nr:transporter substrate-binding protein [Paracoccaceae bacterium]
MRTPIEIGVLFSRSGSYALLGETCRHGALRAIAEIEADSSLPFRFIPVEFDPGGNVDRYRPLCAQILGTTRARHIVGCVTSWSRKEVIPELEKAGGTLWYPCPYEGFEASEHVVYAHACPNQHLLPLLRWTFPRFGRRGYLVGSNYIWGWEVGRVARDLILDAGGEALGDRYVPIGDTDVDRLVAEIRATRPNFVLNSLIGPSSYAFLEAYAALGREDPYFTAATSPVLSCNLTESELGALGDSGEGLISAGPYFRDPNLPGAFGSSFEAAAYGAVRTLAAKLGAGRPDADLATLLARPTNGGLKLDARTQHAVLPVAIAQVRDGVFRTLARWEDVAPDPYLSRRDSCPASSRPPLSVVS